MRDGLICLTGGDEGPLAHALAHGGSGGGAECVQRALRTVRAGQCVRGIAAAFLPRRRSAQSGCDRNRAEIELAAAGDQWRLLRDAASSAKCWMCFTCIRNHRTLATAGRLLARNSERHLKSPAEMARLFRRSSRSDCQHAGFFLRACNFTLNDLGYEFPNYPVPDGEPQMEFLARAHAGRHDVALRRGQRARAQAD